MSPRHAALIALVILLRVAVPSGQIARATITSEGPVFIRPGAETALRILAIGTDLKVMQEDAGWVEVEFTDPQFGRRVGWVETKLIRTTLDDAARRGAPRVEARVVADRPLQSPQASDDSTAEAASELRQAVAKLTQLFNEARIKHPSIAVERIVMDIDESVLKARFPEWQSTSEGERLVHHEFRKVLLRYQLHRDQQLSDRAFAYVRRYY
jgi:hypothetical protein